MKTIFELDNEGNLTVKEPGRAEAKICKVEGSHSFFTFIQVINGFGGENQITLLTTTRQDGKVDTLILHSRVDTGTKVLFHELLPWKEEIDRVLEELNKIWS